MKAMQRFPFLLIFTFICHIAACSPVGQGRGPNDQAPRAAVSGSEDRESDQVVSSREDREPDHAATSSGCAEPEVTIEINQNKFHGDSHSIDVDSSRRIVYLVTDYHGVYHIPLSDNHGNPIVNEVGGTYWKDGMYVSGALTLPDGTERPLGFRHRFIDANEPENWYDLELPPVARVRFDFFHDPEYADELLALPRAERTSILLRRIIVRYGDPEGLVHDSFMYNPDTMTPEVSPEVAMSDRAVLVPDGGSHRVTVSSGRRICRVDVRWGDAKPRINEMYQQGHADGLMLVNGQAQGDWRSLSFIETEIFAGIDQEPVTGEQSIEFRFRGDPARIHWINVYYHDQ